MKRIVLAYLFLMSIAYASAQLPAFSLNPRFSTFYSSYSLAGATNSNLDLGWGVGIGVELGKKQYFEPGIQYMSYSTIQQIASNSVSSANVQMGFSAMQMQAYYGIKLVDLKVFSAKFHVGPTYDFISPRKITELNIEESDFESGKWGLDAGIGLKFLFLTAFVDYNLELSPVLIELNAKQGTLSLTLGVSLF
jgi:hypothetical protein